MLSENAFKEMPTLADKSSDFGFSSGIQVYFWTQRFGSRNGDSMAKNSSVVASMLSPTLKQRD